MYIVEIEHTLHPGGRSTKKRQWEIYKTPLRNKNSPKRISRWYTHSSKQDYIQTEWIEFTNEWKKMNAILPSVYADLNLSFIINYTPSSARRSFFCCAKITNVTSFNCNLRSRKGNNLRKLAIAFCQPFFLFADSQTARLGFYGLLAVG